MGMKLKNVYLWLFILLSGIPLKTKLKLLNLIVRSYKYQYEIKMYKVTYIKQGFNAIPVFI